MIRRLPAIQKIPGNRSSGVWIAGDYFVRLIVTISLIEPAKDFLFQFGEQLRVLFPSLSSHSCIAGLPAFQATGTNGVILTHGSEFTVLMTGDLDIALPSFKMLDHPRYRVFELLAIHIPHHDVQCPASWQLLEFSHGNDKRTNFFEKGVYCMLHREINYKAVYLHLTNQLRNIRACVSKNIKQTQPQNQGVESLFSNEEIREQLDRILGHAEFQATEKNRDFLRYIVEETLAGRSERIKGFSIACEVFGRDSDFDASHDPVVRIQAGRLRRAIERYYLVAGMQDPICIEIPKGHYIPVFAKGSSPKPLPSRAKNLPSQSKLAESCPVVLIVPFKDLTGKPECAYLGLGLATELSFALGHCADLRVMQYREDSSSVVGTGIKPDFTVEGSVFCDDNNLKIVAQLFDSKTGVQLWVDSVKSPFESEQLIDFQENVANSISVHIAGEQGAITRAMTSLSSQPSRSNLTTYQAILKGYSYSEKIDVDTYQQAFEALQHEVTKGCDSGLCFTMLSILYIENIAFEYFDLDHTPLDEALSMARKGVLLAPDNQFSHYALARAHFLKNELEQALNDVERSLALQPESLLFMDTIGYKLILLGEWDRGEQLVRKAIRLNPFYRAYARYGLWLNAFRQQEYTRALEETEWIADIGTFWGPLARAATLGQMACPEEAYEEVQRLLVFKPNFAERGRFLIGHAVKFPEIAERLIEGLSLAGMDID